MSQGIYLCVCVWVGVITPTCPLFPGVVYVRGYLPVSQGLPGAGGVSDTSDAGQWLPLLQEEFH